VSATTVYDNANQVTSITDKTASATLAQFTYARNNDNNVTSDVTTGIAGGTETYGYTSLSQLASRSGKPFTYDAAGNLTGFPTGVNQAFNAGDELTTSTTPATTKAPVLDQSVSANQTGKGTKITSPRVSTQGGDELLLAFISASGPSTGSQTITGVTGGGLVWKEVARSNKQAGTAEIWQAYAITPVTSAAITATLGAAGQDGSITVAAFTGAAPVAGAHATANGHSTHPAVSLTTTQPHSLVWAAGEDPTHAGTLTPANGQALVHQEADTKVHATYWAQDVTKPVATANTTVTIADTLPATDHWNLAAVEIPSATAATVDTTYSYDPQGNLTKIAPSNGPATTLGYDQANRLTSYGGTATYAYNGDGLLMSRTISGNVTQFAWDTSDSLPLLLVNGPVYFIYGPGGQPIEHISGKAVDYLQTDQAGSVRLMTNSAGQNVGTYNYTSYGQIIGHTGTATSALQYDGQFTDSESGLIYLRARFYDPGTGQFTTADLAGSLTQTPFSYADDNPINLQDPAGLCPWCIAAVIGGIAGAVVGGANYLLTHPQPTSSGFWGATLGGAVGGAIGGLCVTAAVGAAAVCGGIAGGIGTAVNNYITTGDFNWGDIVANTAIGAVTGGVGAAFFPINSGWFPPSNWSNVFQPGVWATIAWKGSAFGAISSNALNDLWNYINAPAPGPACN
jgi:RHS repeat-associated protein